MKHSKNNPVLVLFICVLLGILSFFVIIQMNRGDSGMAYPTFEDAKNYTFKLFEFEKNISQGKGVSENTYIDIAKKRKEALEHLLSEQKIADVVRLIAVNGFENAPPGALDYLEKNLTVKGILRVVSGENIVGKNHEPIQMYFLESSGDWQKLYINNNLSDEYVNNEVTVENAIKIGTTIVIQPEKLKLTQTFMHGIASTQKKMEIIPLYFSVANKDPKGININKDIASVDGESSAISYISKLSENTLTLNGIVRDPVTINRKMSDCDYSAWSKIANEELAKRNIQLINADSIVYLMPKQDECKWSGLADVGKLGSKKQRVWLNGDTDKSLIARLLFRNWGLWRSEALRCKDKQKNIAVLSYDSLCTSKNSDPFSVFSMETETPMLSTFQKYQLGIYKQDSVMNITTSGMYKLYRKNSSSPEKLLRIPISLGINSEYTKWLYIEASEQPNNQIGLIIRRVVSADQHYTSDLLDMSPETDTFSDAPLSEDSSYTIPSKNVSIEFISKSDDSVLVRIYLDFSGCVRSDPTFIVSPISQWAKSGKAIKYYLTIINNDSKYCSDVQRYKLSSAQSPGLFQSFSIPEPYLSSGALSNIEVTVTPSPGLTPGLFDISQILTKSGDDSAPSYSTTASFNIMY